MSALRKFAPWRRWSRRTAARAAVVFAASLAASLPASAQSRPAQDAPARQAAEGDAPIIGSQLDAQLFYELLVGEIELREGDSGTAYRLLLDAARRTSNETLFKRATDVALQARAGEQALDAVVAWRKAVPESTDAMRYQVQLLVALNRVGETEEPLVALLKGSPKPTLPGLIDAVPRLLARSADRAAAASVVEKTMQPFLDDGDTRVAALVAVGRGWLGAGEPAKALDHAQRAAALDPAADGPALLALEMLRTTPAAEGIVRARVAAAPANPALRLLYVRTLASAQRLADAATEARAITAASPDLAPPWLTLGAIELELKHPREATVALQAYAKLVEGGAAVTLDAAGGEGDEAPASASNALTQAWLLLAQAAEQQRDFAGAEAWLAKIDNTASALEVQTRRASLLAKQGRLAEGRALIRRAPEQTAADARAKVLAEAQLLREAKQWSELAGLLGRANERWPDDADLVYEHAMAEEKLDRVDTMETLLRKVIALKPDNANAYNALGYSLAERKVRLGEARDLIRKALELSPNEPFITDSLGWVEYRLGNRDEAIRLLRTAYQARPDTEIGAHLGEVLWTDGRTDEARKVWREARSRDAANDVLVETLARLRVDL